MTDAEALLARILAVPEDDTLRLVYADAIQDEGDESRAEFIRTQIDLARLPPVRPLYATKNFDIRGSRQHPNADRYPEAVQRVPDKLSAELPYRIGLGVVVDIDCLYHGRTGDTLRAHGCVCRELIAINPSRFRHEFFVTGNPDPNRERHDELRAREKDLFANRCRTWFPNIDNAEFKWNVPGELWSYAGCWFARGFAEAVTCTAAGFLANAHAIFAAHPVARVTLTTLPELRYDFQGGDLPRFVHLPGHHDKKVPTHLTRRAADEAVRALAAVWPKVTFTLQPTGGYPDPNGTYLPDFNTAYNEMLRDTMRSFGIPSHLLAPTDTVSLTPHQLSQYMRVPDEIARGMLVPPEYGEIIPLLRPPAEDDADE